MGLDGGTVISRSDVLRGASWDVAQSDASRSSRGGVTRLRTAERPHESVADDARWHCCALSGEALRADEAVCCASGLLYNKSAVLSHLLALRGVGGESAQFALSNRALAGARLPLSTRDMFPLKLTKRAKAAAAGGGDCSRGGGPRWECAASGVALSNASRFVALRTCGHVVSEKAAGHTPGSCPACGAAVQRKIELFPTTVAEGSPAAASSAVAAASTQRRAHKRAREGGGGGGGAPEAAEHG